MPARFSAPIRAGGVSLALALAACGGRDPQEPAPDAPDGFDRRALLEHLATRLLVPIHEQTVTATGDLAVAIEAHCAAGGDAAAPRAAAQAAWRAAIDAWQRADAVLVGPAAMDFRALRDRIYAWPLLATCGVDRDVAAHWPDASGYDVATRPNNVRSLAAIEYLLFASGGGHTCFAEPPGWGQLGADLPRARCRLAAAIAGDVAAQARVVASAWRPAEGNFVGQLVGAGTDASSIRSLQAAVNQVTDGFFYVDRMVKDMKIAEAAGIAANSCETVQQACDREVEHFYADHGKAAIVINLRTLREAFTGTTAAAGGDSRVLCAMPGRAAVCGGAAGEGPGFDDHLRAVGATELADRMTAELDAAIAAVEAIPDGYLAALRSDRDRVVAAHAAVKAFTDDLKSQFLTVLGLDIPDDVATDND